MARKSPHSRNAGTMKSVCCSPNRQRRYCWDQSTHSYPIISNVCNASLREGVLPVSQKGVCVTPIVNKANLDPDEMKSYRETHWKDGSQQLAIHLDAFHLICVEVTLCDTWCCWRSASDNTWSQHKCAPIRNIFPCWCSSSSVTLFLSGC